MSQQIIIYISIFIFFISCKKDKYYAPDKIKYVSTLMKYDKICGDVIPISIFGVYQINAVDSLLIFITSNPNGLISIVNTNDNTLICNIGCKGRAQNEYSLPSSLKQYKTNENGDKLLYITDNLYRINELNITQSIKKNIAVCGESTNIDIMRQISFQLQPDGIFFKQNISYDDARDNIFRSPKYVLRRDTQDKEYNIYPDVVVSAKYPHLPLSVYESIINIKPDQTKIVDVMGCIDNMNILDLKTGSSIGVIENNTPFLGDLITFNHEELIGTLKYCAIDISVTDNYIMILYDGRTIYNADVKKDVFKPVLKVFNWDGDFICGYQFSESLRGIAYNEDNQCLYGFDTEDNIYRYQFEIK